MASDFDIFHDRVLADASIQAALDRTIDPDAFARDAGRIARALGLNVPADRLRSRGRAGRLRPGHGWAPDGWLPVALVRRDGAPVMDWARFGEAPLTRSFYADSVAEATARPFNRVFRHSTSLDSFIGDAAQQPTTALAGLVFHMSRCGSTLVAQMLATLDATISLAEPGPLDSALRFALERDDLPRAFHVDLLRTTVAALARPRGGERRCFVKLDSWHILAMPLLRDAFPDVPWIYLFRDPVEVLVSQLRMRGYQTVPSLVPKGIYGPDDMLAVTPERQCAQILARHHVAALRALDAGGGIAVDYAELPGAFETRIAAHFGLDLSAGERTRLAAHGSNDAKFPDRPFIADGAEKRRGATETVRQAGAGLEETHARLRELAAIGGA